MSLSTQCRRNVTKIRLFKSAIVSIALFSSIGSCHFVLAQEVSAEATLTAETANEDTEQTPSFNTEVSNLIESEVDSVIVDSNTDVVSKSELTKEQKQQLSDIEHLLKKGEITQEEYEAQKNQILNTQALEASALRVGEPASPESQTQGKYVAPVVSVTDGSLNYEYPIILPPGRNGMTPDLKLVYSSANKSVSSIFSQGWSLNIPYIQRLNKTGVDKLYATNHFFSSTDGELVDQGSGVFKPRTENGAFSKYEFVNSTWIVTDKSGTKFTFGATTQSRQSNPNDASKVFVWMLESVQDSNGNTISYTYFKNQGQIYPDSIKYNQNNFFEVKFNRASTTLIQTSNLSAFPIKTALKINRVDVFENGVLSTKYDLTYTNNTLEKVLVTGYESGQSVSLPETKFTYTPNSGNGWNTTPSFSEYNAMQFSSNDASLNNNARQHIDVNGDGLADNVWAVRKTSTIYTNTKLATGSGFTSSAAYTIPVSLGGYFWSDNGDATNLQLSDINGDGLPDLILYGSSALYIYLNNGNGWNASASITHYYQNTFSTDNFNKNMKARRFVDVNADGIADLVWLLKLTNGTYYSTTMLGTGTGFVSSTQYTIPTALGAWLWYEADGSSNLQFTDFNGDGLNDLVVYGNLALYVYLNNGSGWDTSASALHYYQYTFGTNNFARNVNARQFVDINNDGLSDLVWLLKFATSYYSTVHLSTGTGFVSNTAYVLPVSFDGYFYNESDGSSNIQLADVNGDGAVDLSKLTYESSFKGVRYYLNNTLQSNLVSKIVEPTLGQTTIQYATAQLQSPTTNKVPFTVPVVQSVTKNDQNAVVSTTTHQYLNARFYFRSPTDRKFAGFGEIVKTNPDGSKVTTKYHQANGQTGNEPVDTYAKIGKVYEETTANSANSLYLRKRMSYVDSVIGTSATSSLLTSTLTQQYDGTSNHTDSATTYSYDVYGNITAETQYGEVSGSADGTFTDSGTDKRTIESTYTNDTANYIIGLPKSRVIKNNAGTAEAQTMYRYDVKGNQLEEGKWISGTAFATTTRAYNSFGLVTSESDPLGNVTTYTYDTYNFYPTTLTNALSQSTVYTYDYSSGKPKTVTNPNGHIRQYLYDGLDRLIEERQTQANNTTADTVRTLAYNTAVSPQYISEMQYRTATKIREIRSYLDGFGREIQKKSQYQSGWITVDTIYDGLGRVLKTSIPYNTTTNAKSAATTNSAQLIVNTLDVLGRTLTTTDARGVTTMVYSGLKTAVTDALSHLKEYTNDTFGNLVQVKEYNGASIYTTNYTYNTLNLLTNITDAEGNVRAIVYDGLGRRTLLQDLHAPSDSTFGALTFVYNKNNLTSLTTPNGVTTSYTYDALNRVKSEDASATVATDIIYAYDSCINGIGFVCTVGTPVATSSYTYYKQGLVQAKAQVLSGTSYTTNTTYNRQNQPVSVTYPNGSVITNTYTTEGLPATVALNGIVQATSTYGVHGKPLTVTYKNGLTTTNTYNANKLYELTSKQTTTSGNQNLQNLTYTYDAVGNITSLVDSSVTQTKKNQTLTYDDLYRLTGVTTTNVASGTTPYAQTFAYSPIGNITSFNGASFTYTGTNYANPHAATTISGVTQTYDNNGNLTSDTVWNHAWDYRNRLITSTKGTTTTSYQYNHENNRTKLTENGVVTLYPFADYEVTSGTPKLYLSLGEVPVATNIGTTTTYLHTDHLGGTTLTTNQTGTVTKTLDYYPYGETRVDSGANTEKEQFTGYKKDSTTGLNYAGARYHAGNYGRFISQDPVFRAIGNPSEIQRLTKVDLNKVLMDPQAMNSYSYARNNPIRYSDPEGLWFKEVMTGQQFYADFRVEVGQATQYMTDNSAAWNYAVSNPMKAGLAVGVTSAAAAVPASAAVINLATIQAGVGIGYVGKMAVGATAYGYVAKNALQSTPEIATAYSQFKTSDTSTWKSPVYKTATLYGPGSLNAHAGAMYDLYDSILNLAKDLGLKVNNTKESTQKSTNKKEK